MPEAWLALGSQAPISLLKKKPFLEFTVLDFMEMTSFDIYPYIEFFEVVIIFFAFHTEA